MMFRDLEPDPIFRRLIFLEHNNIKNKYLCSKITPTKTKAINYLT